MISKSLALLALAPAAVRAMPANSNSFSPSQPNGHPTSCLMQLIGSPGYHYTICEATPAGYYSTAVNQNDQFIYYGELQGGQLVPGDKIVGEDNPEESGIAKGQIENAGVAHEKCMQNDFCKWKSENDGASGQDVPDEDYDNLVIPFYFSDHTDRLMLIEDIKSDTFNDDHISVKDFFEKQSGGKISWQNTFANPVTITKTEAYCADNASGTTNKMKDECLTEVLDLVEDEFPSDFDGLTFMHSGFGAEHGNRDEYGVYLDDRIWSHSWEVNTGVTDRRYALISAWYGTDNDRYQHVGVAIHEIAQMLGAPTQYGPEPGNGLGYYDVMANPFGFDGDLHHCGSMSAYTKVLLDWADVEEITESGVYTIENSMTSNKVYKISKGFPTDEYYLIEYRIRAGYDMGLRQPGLAIYHVDELANGMPGYPGDGSYPDNHYEVSLIQADGRFDLETEHTHGDIGDLFYHGGVDGITPDGPLVNGQPTDAEYPNTKAYSNGFKDTGLTIKDISLPGEVMSFTVSFEDVTSSS